MERKWNLNREEQLLSTRKELLEILKYSHQFVEIILFRCSKSPPLYQGQILKILPAG